MKVRFEVESLPKPKDNAEHVIFFLLERIDIICRVIVQRWRK